MKTKIMNLLAALALTAAALATPSAFGYGAFTAASNHYGLVLNNTVSIADARRIAMERCVASIGEDAPNVGNCAVSIRDIENQCIAIISSGTSALEQISDTLADATSSATNTLPFVPGGMIIVFGEDEDACDHTCDFDQPRNAINVPGCGADCTDDMPIGDGENCRAIENATDCGNIAMRDDTPELIYYDDNGGCRAALTCPEDDDGIPNEQGGCTLCTGQEEIDNQCFDLCGDNEMRNGTACDCVDTHERLTDEGSCVVKCDEETETRVGETCMPIEDMGGDPVGGDMTEPPEFTIEAGGMNLTTTADGGYEVAFDDVLATKITVATTVTGFTYEKTGNSSEELDVGMEDGVVGFNTTVSAGDYQIFVAANNNTVVATISVYLTVAAAIDNGNDGDTGTTPTSSGGGGGGSAAGIIGGVVVVALALWYFTSGSDDLTWTPSYAFANNNGNMSYSVGSRWTATANDWQIYWQTRQTDKFVYGSGMSYNGDILSATMNSESEGKKTALDVDLSANKTVGLWNLGGGYNFDMQLSETETDTKNRLNAKVRYTMDKWILSANANTDGDTGTARINYSYRF